MYEYNATVTKVYDGDTITVDIDLGLNMIFTGQKIRLFGIDTPEVRGDEREEGLKSRDWLQGMILGKSILIRTIKDKKGKYGRYLGKIYIGNLCLNDELVTLGLAEYVTY